MCSQKSFLYKCGHLRTEVIACTIALQQAFPRGRCNRPLEVRKFEGKICPQCETPTSDKAAGPSKVDKTASADSAIDPSEPNTPEPTAPELHTPEPTPEPSSTLEPNIPESDTEARFDDVALTPRLPEVLLLDQFETAPNGEPATAMERNVLARASTLANRWMPSWFGQAPQRRRLDNDNREDGTNEIPLERDAERIGSSYEML